MHKNQKEFYLNEQLKAIRKELGHQNEFASEIEELQTAIKKARMPREVTVKAIKELDRLAEDELHVARGDGGAQLPRLGRCRCRGAS